jgi:hypothetical protein
MKSKEEIKQVLNILELTLNKALSKNDKKAANTLYLICWWLNWVLDKEKEFEERTQLFKNEDCLE